MPQPTKEYKEKENDYRPRLDVFQSMLSWGLPNFPLPFPLALLPFFISLLTMDQLQ